MTRSARPRPQAPPLAVTLRAALAQGWHTLDALEALAGRATGARLRVHAALAELRAEGCALEERVERGVAEVRELPPVADGATCPDHPTLRDPSPPVEGEPVDAASYYLGRGREEEDLPVPDPRDLDAIRAEAIATIEAEGGEEDWDTPAELVDAVIDRARIVARQGVEVGEAWESECSNFGLSQEASVALEPVWRVAFVTPKGPGPSSRCARCGEQYRHHATNSTLNPHPFQPKPRGRPRVAPAVPSPALDAPAVEPEPCPPCVDCGEERGTCPEGRCRDCDLEHGMSAGACRECHTWIIREDVGGPFAKQHTKGCSLADSDDWHPRNAAEYAAVRTARYGWAPEPRRGCEREFPAARVAPIVIAPPRPAGRCRPPQCHADDIHVPSAVRGFARPLCERHRRWVEGAGGTLARADALDVIH